MEQEIAQSNRDSHQRSNRGSRQRSNQGSRQQSNRGSRQQPNQDIGTVHVEGGAYINFKI